MGMTKKEVLVTPYGEMMDMIACMNIDAGAKQKKEELTQEQILFELM